MDWSRTHIVLLSGDGVNTCGHIILHVGGGFGYYFQFTGPNIYDWPVMLRGETEYQRYLSEAKKHELIRRKCAIPHPDRAAQRLYELMNNKWLTLVVSHNCAAFVGEVLRAGGNFYTIPDHCPVLDMGSEQFWEKIFGPLRNLIGTQKAYEAKHVH